MYQLCRMLFIIALWASSWQFSHLCIFNCQVSQGKHSLEPPLRLCFFFFFCPLFFWRSFCGCFFPLSFSPLYAAVSEGRGPGHRQVSQSPGNGMGGKKKLTVHLQLAGACWGSESFGSQGFGSEFR